MPAGKLTLVASSKNQRQPYKKKPVKTAKIVINTKKSRPKNKSGRGKIMKTQPFGRTEYAKLGYDWADNLISGTTQYQAGTREGHYINDLNRPYLNQAAGDPLPAGYDTYNGYFNNFKVYQCDVDLTIAPNTSGKDITLMVQINNSNTDTSNYSLTGTTELTNSGKVNTWFYQLPTDKPFKFKRKCDISKLDGITLEQLRNDLTVYVGTLNSSIASAGAAAPVRELYIQYALVNNTDATAVSLPINAKLHYYSQFTTRSRTALSQSDS